jgi:hypothetical protein
MNKFPMPYVRINISFFFKWISIQFNIFNKCYLSIYLFVLFIHIYFELKYLTLSLPTYIYGHEKMHNMCIFMSMLFMLNCYLTWTLLMILFPFLQIIVVVGMFMIKLKTFKLWLHRSLKWIEVQHLGENHIHPN